MLKNCVSVRTRVIWKSASGFSSSTRQSKFKCFYLENIHIISGEQKGILFTFYHLQETNAFIVPLLNDSSFSFTGHATAAVRF